MDELTLERAVTTAQAAHIGSLTTSLLRESTLRAAAERALDDTRALLQVSERDLEEARTLLSGPGAPRVSPPHILTNEASLSDS